MNKDSIEDKIRAYVLNLEKAIDSLKKISLEEKYRRIVDIADSYLNDAKYYLSKNDYFTALSCIAYAEGLIDSLNYIGVINIKWNALTKLLKRPRVVIAGSFEIIHPGHLYFIKKAWELGEVIVIVARDSSIERFKKRRSIIPEEQRKIVVENIKYVSKAYLGDPVDYFKTIVDLKPDIVLLGPDQWIEPDDLKEELEKRGLTNISVVKLDNRIEGEFYSVSRIIERIKKSDS
ncbi:MAG: DUF357 domain-containing protein [Desulfurococcaceae archaeon]